MSQPITRRTLLQGGASAAALSTALGGAACGDAPARTAAAAEEVYLRLGVKPVINGVGTVTNLGGSIMPPEVIEAMAAASKYFIPFQELQEKAGDHLAKIIGVPAAMISCGAASAITCGTAVAVTRGDDEKLQALPETSGMKNEIIIQKAHRCGYEAQMTVVGARHVWVETREELGKAISDRTAMMFFLNKADPLGQIQRKEWIEVAKAHDIPTLNDAAADVPPAERLHTYVEEGFDMVIFSGGKGLLGPQGAGLLLGRADLILAARKAISPHGGIGRGMKVGKEEVIGLVAAVERYLSVDHAAERRELDERAARVIDALAGVAAVSCRKDVPEIANNVPHVLVEWTESKAGLTSQEAVEKLLAGDPPVAVSRGGEGQLRISMWMLRPGQDVIVAERVKSLFA
jgi:L-seryl-tRNA(Ser) seleniumtransferase